ncbi:MAG: hypothetical protein ACRCX4_06985 [Bacteroidales bacterium]
MKKLKLSEIIAVGLVIAGTVLIFINMFIPPVGIIADSALFALGQFFTLAGALFGLDLKWGTKINSIESKINKNNNNDEDNIQ